MIAHLLDASVVIAATDTEHVHHARVGRWFDADPGPLALCPVVEGALVRYLVRAGVATVSALEVLAGACSARGVTFWPDDLSYRDVDLSRVQGHRQVTDAYLVALAVARSGKLATLDERLHRVHPDESVLVPD